MTYPLTGEALPSFNFDCSCLNCELGCSDREHARHIDDLINVLLQSLSELNKYSQYSTLGLTHFSNEELDELKQKSIFWHEIWRNAGRPSSGTIHQIKCSCKLKYKLPIKIDFREHENEHNDELYELFLNKDTPEFWKCWSSKFRKNI